MPGHQKVVKPALLWPLWCASPTPTMPSDLPDPCVLLSGAASGNFLRVEPRYAPIMCRGMPPNKHNSSNCTFCTVPSQESTFKLVANWTSRLLQNDYQLEHVANKINTAQKRGGVGGGGGFYVIAPPLKNLLRWVPPEKTTQIQGGNYMRPRPVKRR